MDFEKARFNMVEQQIRPWDVLDFKLLDILQELPREDFVEEAQRAYAYADMNLRLPNKSYMLEPKIIARLIQALKIQENDRVLEIGTGGGYATAILAKSAHEVITFDIDGEQSARAAGVLQKLNINNVSYRVADGFQAAVSENTEYNAVYIGGGVNDVPEGLCQKLAVGGRLAVIAGEAPVQRALLITRTDDGTFTRKPLFETRVPNLIQGEKSLGRETFVF